MAQKPTAMKRPAFQFYPADWRKDLELGACGYIARGIWFEMLCVMHEAQPYGFFVRNGSPIPDEAAANLLRCPVAVYRKAVAELELNGVLSRDADGLIFSRRMVRDERLRNVRADAGRLGGNPNLVNQNASKPKPPDNHRVKQSPTPSSSSSSSSSTSDKAYGEGSADPPRAQARDLPTDEHRQIAAVQGVDCQAEWSRYTDWLAAKGKTHRNREAGFRNWLRKAGEFKARDAPRKTAADRRQDVADQIFRRGNHASPSLTERDITATAERVD